MTGAATARGGDPAQVDQLPAEVAPHIVDAARHVLTQEGLAAATLERISAAAGVSRMTLHRRGLSRRDILGAVAARLTDEYREAMWSALVAEGTARDRLQAALEAQCRLSERNLATLQALSATAHDSIFHESGPAARTREVFGPRCSACCSTEPWTARCGPSTIRPRRPPCCSTPWPTPTATCGPGTVGARSRWAGP